MDDIERDNMIRETHDSVLQVQTVLLGVPGTDDGGLVEKVGDVCDSHTKLKTTVYWLIGILAGSGVITGTTIGIAKATGGG